MKLYAYTFPTYQEHKSYIKVGDTTRTVEERVHEQFGTSNPEKPITLKEWDIGVHRDHDIHRILKKMKKIRVLDNREWFQCSVEDVDIAVNTLLHSTSRANSYKMRGEQAEAVEKAYRYLQEHDEFLWNAKMRFGKTFAAYQLMKRLGAKKTIVLTYKPSVLEGWKSDLDNHIDFNDYAFFHALDFDKNQPIEFDSENSVLFASFQDIVGNTKSLKEKWENVLEARYDLLIIDEVHFGANSQKAKELLSLLNVDKTLVMSGTPVKLLLGGVYDEDQIYTWSYIDEQKKRKAEKSKKWETEIYKWLPEMHLYTYSLSDITEHDSAFYSKEEGLTLNKFFGSENGDSLNNDGAVHLWLDNLACPNRRKFLSPFRLDSTNLKHMYWYLSGVNSVKALAKKLREHSFFKKYVILAAADDNEGMGSDTLDLVKTEINKVEKGFYPDKVGTITLSCGKLNTGVSVPEWNSVWMLSDTKSVETYMQTIFRAQTPNESSQKEDAYVFDFNPNRALEMIYDYNEYVAKSDESTPCSIRKFIECFEVLSYEDNELKEIDAEKIISAGTNADTAISRFGSERMVNVVNANLKIAELLVGIEKARAIKKKLDVSSNKVKNGKTFSIETISNREKEKDIMKDLLAKAVAITKTIPTFMFDTEESIESVSDIINTSDTETFKDDVKISIDSFKEMVDAGLFNVKMLNRSIEALNIGLGKNTDDPVESLENKLAFLSKLYSPSNNEVYTPVELIEEILDKLPAKVWKDKDLKWFNPAVKTGAFLGSIVVRLAKSYVKNGIFNNEKDAYSHIIENQIYGYALTRGALKTANKLVYSNARHAGKIECRDLLEENTEMKFDVIVGNPPFQSPSKNKKRNIGATKNLYQKFIELSCSLVRTDESIISLIAPHGFLKSTKWGKPNKYFSLLNNRGISYLKMQGVIDYFNVGSPFCYFISNKSENITIESKDVVVEKNKNLFFVPSSLDSHTLSIFDKVSSVEGINLSFERLNRKPSGSFVAIKPMNNRLHGMKATTNIKNQSLGNDLIWEHPNALNICSILNTEIFSYLIRRAQYDALIYFGFINGFKIPFDLSKEWSKNDLYDFYKFNDDEIKSIESFGVNYLK